ncbi:MAG: CHAT domain-containing protein, partial [Thermoguttaceae bacterium]
AGANRAGKTEIDPLSDKRDDNGILTAEEIGTQNLDGVQLVVLSACETGLGKSAGGEGVLGLQRSFQAAGARNVVASLWPVDDKATAALMTVFYTKLWKEHKSPIDALREAQLYIYHHPNEISKLADSRTLNANKTRPIPTDSAAEPSKTASPELWAGFVLSGGAKVETRAKPPAGRQDIRTWKRKDGKTTELRFVAVEGANVKLQRADGKTHLVLLKTLSDDDQQWVAERGKK